jgi:hypothetical protein
VMRELFVRGQRLSVVGALSMEGMITSTVVYDVSQVFELLGTQCGASLLCRAHFSYLSASFRLPLCSAYPGKHSVLIMDNACIHHGEEILELTRCYGKSFDR